MKNKPLQLTFEKGNILIPTKEKHLLLEQFSWLNYDLRTQSYRCFGYHYRDLILALQKNISYKDQIKAYQELSLKLQLPFESHSYQKEAMKKWSEKKKGLLVLPTGSGKSILAAMIMEKINRSTLVVVPTIELLIQWHKNLKEYFQCKIGMLGGGSKEIEAITVSTYDSARIYHEKLGNAFCLIVFDECHHLGSEGYAQMAKSYIAPYRLGLTATPDEEEYRLELVRDILGSIVYEKDIRELSGDFLSDYKIKTIYVELTPNEKMEYDEHRKKYLDYKKGVVGFNQSWQDFVFHCSRSHKGRQALKSFYIQKQIALTAAEKFVKLIKILYLHKKERILIFTNDNKTAYFLSSKLLLPVITHEIKTVERKKILENFHNGKWNILISTRVLNEGIDVPLASVAVIFSGNSTVREQVQRLGRILRKKEGKKAYLYELVSKNTSEFFSSQKRKKHSALQR